MTDLERTKIMKDLVLRLNDELLTHLMLGHRELFHSNLLAWFFQRMPDAADQVFGSLTTENPGVENVMREVKREKNNLDLWFRWPDRKALVLENKVFRLPDERQLESYAGTAQGCGGNPSLWLLSLTDPVWVGNRKIIGGSEWRWLPYKDLAERIRLALASDDHSYEAETMRRYADVVDLLSELAANVVVTDSNETVALPEDVQNALGDDRLTAGLARLRARSVAHRVSQALDAAGIAEAAVESGFTNDLPLNSWFAPIDRAPSARAGWQLQNNQFRLAIITPHLEGRSEAERQARYEFANANEDLFDFGYLDEILGTAASPTRPSPRRNSPLGFNRFDPDFVYRYKEAPHLEVGQLEKAAVAVARRLGTPGNANARIRRD